MDSSKTKIKWRNDTFFFIFVNTYWTIWSFIGFTRIIYKIIFLNNIVAICIIRISNILIEKITLWH